MKYEVVLNMLLGAIGRTGRPQSCKLSLRLRGLGGEEGVSNTPLGLTGVKPRRIERGFAHSAAAEAMTAQEACAD